MSREVGDSVRNTNQVQKKIRKIVTRKNKVFYSIQIPTPTKVKNSFNTKPAFDNKANHVTLSNISDGFH